VTLQNRYKLKPHGRLLWTKAAFSYQDSELVITARLLIDTGASYTAISDRLLRALIDTPIPLRQQAIMTASEQIWAPVIAVPWLNCLGKQMPNFPVIAIPLPSSTFVDGLVGIDFLRLCGAIIDIDRSEILVTK
jgi:predicted aspartyl protease